MKIDSLEQYVEALKKECERRGYTVLRAEPSVPDGDLGTIVQIYTTSYAGKPISFAREDSTFLCGPGWTWETLFKHYSES